LDGKKEARTGSNQGFIEPRVRRGDNTVDMGDEAASFWFQVCSTMKKPISPEMCGFRATQKRFALGAQSKL